MENWGSVHKLGEEAGRNEIFDEGKATEDDDGTAGAVGGRVGHGSEGLLDFGRMGADHFREEALGGGVGRNTDG
jgi:hypothetical protein